jgi:hypothetical protein
VVKSISQWFWQITLARHKLAGGIVQMMTTDQKSKSILSVNSRFTKTFEAYPTIQIGGILW